ncbi:MAG: S4 domain-containing protein YaaA [Firmicutes bacterium]|nr:S4 domain-containing protein YaaA [Bacillota bacterium]
MKTVAIDTEFIKLGQLLKLADIVSQGSEAKMVISEGNVLVNGNAETRRGRKIFPNDVVEFEGEAVKVISGER